MVEQIIKESLKNTKEAKVGNFTISLTADKYVYRKDEKINVFATFMYSGEQDQITIGMVSRTWVSVLKMIRESLLWMVCSWIY